MSIRAVHVTQKRRVLITPQALADLSALAFAKYPLETGGVLLGQPSDDQGTPWIEMIIGPGEEAVHERHGFQPDHEWQAAEVKRLWEESPAGLTYLGDWHTHPDGTARPSRQDLRAAQQIAQAPQAQQPRPLMLIAGIRRSGQLTLALTQLRQGRLFARELVIGTTSVASPSR